MMSSAFQTVADVLASAQTEILIFVFAICAHAVLFGKYRIVGGNKVDGKRPRLPHGSLGAGRNSSPPQSPLPPSVPSALVRLVQGLLNEEATRDRLALEISRHLLNAIPEQQVEALAGLLGSAGKAASADLLAACRSVLQENDLRASGRLNELLLRGYMHLRLKDEFEDLLEQVESQEGALPSIAVLALRFCIQGGDVEATLDRLPTLVAAWKIGAASTASVAHGQLFQQLIRLAINKSQMPRLFAELQASGLLLPWTVEALLSEFAQSGDVEHAQKATDLARSLGVEFTAGAYAALIRGTRSADVGMQMLEEAAKRAVATKDVLLASARCATAHSSAALAEAVVKNLPANPPSEVAAAVLHLYAQGGPLAGDNADGAILRVYKQLLGGADLSADVRAERLVANAAVRCGQVEVLRQLMASITDNGRQVAVLKSFASERRFKDCFSVFQACPERTSCLYNALLDACIDGRDMKTAERIMAEATQAKLADVVTYNTMIKAHLQNGDSRCARATVGAMRAAGLEPNCVTFNELLDAAIRERPEGVWGLVDEMRACGLKPNHVTCSIVLKSVQRASKAVDVERALAVVEAMEEATDEVLLSSVCEACIRAGRSDLLIRQLHRQRGANGVQVRGAHTFGSIIRAYGFINDVKGVWDTWCEMKTRHIVPTSVTLGCMVEALASNGDPEAGYELIREQVENPQMRPLVNAVIYCSVLKGFSHRRRFDRVWSVYEEMKAEKLQFSIVTYNTLIDACSRSGEMGRIPGLLEEMASERIEPNIITYSTVIKGYCQENRVDKAFELLEDMKRTKQFTPDEVTYNTLLDGCARYGMWERGIRLLEEMQQAGVPPSNFTLSVLVKLANRSKRPDKAFELTEQLCEKYNIRLNVHVFNNLVHACTAHGDLSRALEVLERMLREKVRPDSRTYMLLLRGAIGQRSAEDAAGLLRAAAGVRGTHPRLAGFSPSAAQPKGGLTAEVVSEALEGIAGSCNNETLAVQLLRDLRSAPGISLDPRLPMRLTSKAIHGPLGRRQQQH